MKKISTSSLVLTIVSIALFAVSFYEAYRITSVIEYDVIEILFTYETFIFEIFIILTILYIIVLIKFHDPYQKFDYIIKRIYLMIHIAIASLGYLLGLNLDYLLGNTESFSYQPIINFEVLFPIILVIILLDFFLLNHNKHYRKKPKWIDFLQLILIVFFALLFNLIVTDSTAMMGAFT